MKLFPLAAVFVVTSSALAGPVWTEANQIPPDASRIRPGHVIPFSPVTAIVGTLTGIDTAGGPDIADVYTIMTGGPTVVSTGAASAVLEANFDTVLCLFTTAGLGVVANDDIAVGNTRSQITIPGAGTWVLAVLPKAVQPVSAGGAIFNLFQPGNQFVQLSPTGPGGGQPQNGFAGAPNDPEPRDYTARFTPIASGIPAYSQAGLWILGISFAIGTTIVFRRGIALA